jgi:hypothetical protein
VELAHPDAGLAADALLSIVENRTVFRLGERLHRTVFNAVRLQAMHAALLIKAVVIDLDKGSEQALGGLIVISELLDAPVSAGVAARAECIIQ